MLRVRTIFAGVAGVPWYSNLYFTGLEAAEASTAHDLVAGFWSACAPFIADEVTWTVEGEVLAVSPSTGDAVAAFPQTPVNGAGTNSNQVIPPAVQVLIRLNTTGFFGGRRVIGHINVPGTTEDVWEGGAVAASLQDDFETAALAMTGSPTVPNLAVWSRVNGVDVEVISVDCVPKGGVLRSRRD